MASERVAGSGSERWAQEGLRIGTPTLDERRPASPRDTPFPAPQSRRYAGPRLTPPPSSLSCRARRPRSWRAGRPAAPGAEPQLRGLTPTVPDCVPTGQRQSLRDSGSPTGARSPRDPGKAGRGKGGRFRQGYIRGAAPPSPGKELRRAQGKPEVASLAEERAGGGTCELERDTPPFRSDVSGLGRLPREAGTRDRLDPPRTGGMAPAVLVPAHRSRGPREKEGRTLPKGCPGSPRRTKSAQGRGFLP